MSYQIVVWERNENYETYLVEHVKATGLHILAVPVRMVTHCRIPFPEERIDTRHDFSDYTCVESDAEFTALLAYRRLDSRTGQTCDQGTLPQLPEFVGGSGVCDKHG
jgi:hypothetical protein